MTAAVPVPKTSRNVPFRAAAMTSAMVTGRSATCMPSSLASCNTESRVTPSSKVPVSGGVTSSSPITKAMFMDPTSSMYS